MNLFTRLKNIRCYQRQIVDKHVNKQFHEDGNVVPPMAMTNNEIILKEYGQLKASHYQNNTYNYYRWYLTKTGQLQLSHLRQPRNNGTLLASFDLQSKGVMSASVPFCCGKDCYHAQLISVDSCIILMWSISGPKKNLSINTRYY